MRGGTGTDGQPSYLYAKGRAILRTRKRCAASRSRASLVLRQLRRARIHTALNAQIQGDAARHTKLWMRAVWREGVIPLLQMHDGLELSVTTREQGERVARLACEAVKLEVPMRADIKYGRTWGDAKHGWAELHDGAQNAPAASILVNAVESDDFPATVSTTQIETPQPQVGIPDEANKRTSGLPIGSESEHNLGDDDTGAPPPWTIPTPQSASGAASLPPPRSGNGFDTNARTNHSSNGNVHGR